MSSTFSTNSGSLLSLKVRNKCGFNPCLFQMRRTDASLMPAAWAMVRVLQWVASVRRTICCTCLADICGLRLGRGASFSMPSSPRTINRLSQRATVCRVTPNSAAIFKSGIASAASKIIFERWAKRTLTLRAHACFSSCSRCSSESLTSAATRIVSTLCKVYTMLNIHCPLICDALH